MAMAAVVFLVEFRGRVACCEMLIGKMFSIRIYLDHSYKPIPVPLGAYSEMKRICITCAHIGKVF